jgi:hypothetical protein
VRISPGQQGRPVFLDCLAGGRDREEVMRPIE